jgi:N-acetylneuraminate lyase
VGSNCLADSKVLAEHAQRNSAAAISAVAPTYFKPKDVDALVGFMSEVAASAPTTPFYYYDIPGLTGITFPTTDFLRKATGKIPTLAGIKFSNPDMIAYQGALHADDGKWDLPFGVDEVMLSALAMGARGFVGSTYNFAAPIYHRLMSAFQAGDFDTARKEQYRSVRIVQLLASYGYMGAAKATMAMLGVGLLLLLFLLLLLLLLLLT